METMTEDMLRLRISELESELARTRHERDDLRRIPDAVARVDGRLTSVGVRELQEAAGVHLQRISELEAHLRDAEEAARHRLEEATQSEVRARAVEVQRAAIEWRVVELEEEVRRLRAADPGEVLELRRRIDIVTQERDGLRSRLASMWAGLQSAGVGP